MVVFAVALNDFELFGRHGAGAVAPSCVSVGAMPANFAFNGLIFHVSVSIIVKNDNPVCFLKNVRAHQLLRYPFCMIQL